MLKLNSVVIKIIVYALLPALSIIISGIITSFKVPSSNIKSYIQHFAAGVVFSVVGVELLPDIIREHAPLQVIIGFASGVLLMLGIRYFSEKYEKVEQNNKSVNGLIIVLAIDILIDGLLIGIGFAAGDKEGKLLTFALTVELLSLGLALSSSLVKAGKSRTNIIITSSLMALFIVIGSLIGATLLQNLSGHTLEIVLSFGLAALLFLVTEELLVEAHEEPETLTSTSSFFAGFLLFLILGMNQ